MAKHTFERYRDGYSRLWAGLEILPAYRRDVDSSVNRILANKSRYQSISADVNVPWWFIAIVHKMESNLNFSRHLHNGDSLERRTWQIPAGRPLRGSPPFTFEESAADALKMKGFHRVTDWSLEHVAFLFETFNGFGYRKYGVPSPYLWSFSNRYSQGKYVKDKVYDPNAISTQSGAMVLLKALMQRDSSVVLHAVDVERIVVDESETLPRAKDKPLRESATLYGVFLSAYAALAWVWGKVAENTAELADLVIEVAKEGQTVLGHVSTYAETFGFSPVKVTVAALVLGLIVAATARISAHKNGKVG